MNRTAGKGCGLFERVGKGRLNGMCEGIRRGAQSKRPSLPRLNSPLLILNTY